MLTLGFRSRIVLSMNTDEKDNPEEVPTYKVVGGRHSHYRHPRHDDIAALIVTGKTDTDIAKELGVGRRAVARVRLILGVEPMTRATALVDKLKQHALPLPSGCTYWDGNRNTDGKAPIIMHRGKQYSAAAIAFEQRTGRKPVGSCRSDCDLRHCLTPAHILDDVERLALRLQMRALLGEPEPWKYCPEGHSWDSEGRVDPRMRLYCRACGNERKKRSDKSRREREAEGE